MYFSVLKALLASLDQEKGGVFVYESVKGPGDGSITTYESVVEIAEVKENLNIAGRTRSGTVGDGCKLLGVHLDTVSTHKEAKARYLMVVELALLGVAKELGSLEVVKNN